MDRRDRIRDFWAQTGLGGRNLASDLERAGYIALPQALPTFLIEAWRTRALAMLQYARTVRHASAGSELMYRVVTGDTIRRHWPELFAFYQDENTLTWVREVTRKPRIAASKHLVSAVNLNILDSIQAVYRWHFDAVPYTVLIYLTATVPEDGGALEFVPGCRPHQIPDLSAAEIVRYFPKAGTVVLMDGTRCYHRVAPMLRPTMRLSIPLVYSDVTSTVRPAGLDSYLYKPATEPSQYLGGHQGARLSHTLLNV